jgi:hypothetical protein
MRAEVLMRTYRVLAVLAVVLVAASAAFVFGGRAQADASDRRIVFLYVSGRGPQAKAWYDGAPPSGVLVQSALDTFTKQGLHFAALTSSGSPALAQPAAPENGPIADYVILLER